MHRGAGRFILELRACADTAQSELCAGGAGCTTPNARRAEAASTSIMLIYRKGDGFKFFFRATGSALPGAVIPGLISAVYTFALGMLPGDYLDKLMVHPYPFQPFAYIAAFALVFRTNVSMQRFNEALTATTQMSSRWGDAVVEARPAAVKRGLLLMSKTQLMTKGVDGATFHLAATMGTGSAARSG